MTDSLKIHLVCVPWLMPRMPSIQMGVLHAHLERRFGNRIQVRSYSAHLAIPYRAAGSAALTFFDTVRQFKEFPYFAIWNGLDKLGKNPPVTKEVLTRLRDVTDAWIDEELLPELDASSQHVVALTLTYDQLYASLHFIRRIREKRGDSNLRFVFGGYCAGLSHVQKCLDDLGIRGFIVEGEGEERLAWVVDHVLKSQEGAKKAPSGVRVLPLVRDTPIIERLPALNLADLPLPNYDEFFTRFKALELRDALFSHVARTQKAPALALEGSRGCFAKCDFCAENSQWTGFRKMDASTVFHRAVAAIERYRCNTVHFLDNVSDSWAEQFSDLVEETGLDISIFCMELRAHHPEEFWSKLKRAGVHSIQVGIESVARGLLKQMSKGTHVLQNLAALKYMGELGIYSQSNLIAYHPKSTLADVAETQATLRLIPHFPRLRVVTFQLFQGSPIFDGLSAEAKANLEPYPAWPKESDFQKGMIGYAFKVPPEIRLPKEVTAAWAKLEKWANGSLYTQTHGLSVTGDSECALVHDRRFRRNRRFTLKGLRARCLDACHGIQRRTTLERILQEKAEDIEACLQYLIEKELLVERDGYLLSLPLRPAEDLLARITEPKAFIGRKSAPVDLGVRL